ncbi:hypothetical protein QE152_g8523 [Popillia japonica]|uniref:Uncharacterized protein n=1 Tax=Popillia japonica TaxID=7064 RepID=A0AAW1MBF6_POPJA
MYTTIKQKLLRNKRYNTYNTSYTRDIIIFSYYSLFVKVERHTNHPTASYLNYLPLLCWLFSLQLRISVSTFAMLAILSPTSNLCRLHPQEDLCLQLNWIVNLFLHYLTTFTPLLLYTHTSGRYHVLLISVPKSNPQFGVSSLIEVLFAMASLFSILTGSLAWNSLLLLFRFYL